MLNLLAHLLAPLLQLLWPAEGRHRRPSRSGSAVRAETRQQRARRRALWLALHGLDSGPRTIHGVQVSA